MEYAGLKALRLNFLPAFAGALRCIALAGGEVTSARR